MTVLEYPSIADPKLVKNKDIPCHSPKIEDKQPNSPKHGKYIFHGIYSTINFNNFDQIED